MTTPLIDAAGTCRMQVMVQLHHLMRMFAIFVAVISFSAVGAPAQEDDTETATDDDEMAIGSDGGERQLAAITEMGITPGDAANTFEWGAVAEAVAYRVYWGLEPVINVESYVVVDTTALLHEGLENGIDYYYSVVAIDADGREGAYPCPESPPGFDNPPGSYSMDVLSPDAAESLADCYHTMVARPESGEEDSADESPASSWSGSATFSDSSGTTQTLTLSWSQHSGMAKGSWRTDGGLGGISVGAVDEASGTFELHLKDAAGNIVCGTVRGTFTGTTGSFILMGSCPGESLTLKGTLSG